MEYIEGASIQQYIKKYACRKFPEEEARYFFKQILEAVNYIHSFGIIHRDLKLENILITKSNKLIKLIDFGFSIITVKKLNVFCGTPSFMAPEIISKQEYYGNTADVWALGVVIYFMLFGDFPFKGG